MSIQIIVVFLKNLKKKLIVLRKLKMKNNFPKRDQIFPLIPYPIFFGEKNLSRKIDV
jgi:hypothetical protein